MYSCIEGLLLVFFKILLAFLIPRLAFLASVPNSFLAALSIFLFALASNLALFAIFISSITGASFLLCLVICFCKKFASLIS